MWLDPNLSLRWGPYFREASEDNSKLVDMVIKAKNEGIIVRRTAIEKIAAIFDIENIDQYEERLEEEDEKNETTAMAMKEAMGGFAPDGSPKKVAQPADGEDDDEEGGPQPAKKGPQPKGPAKFGKK